VLNLNSTNHFSHLIILFNLNLIFMHFHTIVPQHIFNLPTVLKRAYLLLPLLFCTLFLFGSPFHLSDMKAENSFEREKVNIPENEFSSVNHHRVQSTQSRGQCDQNAPYYYNHANLLCSEEDFLEYCLEMGPPIMSLPWPGCEGCCAFQNPQWIVFHSGADSTLSFDLFISECINNQGVRLGVYELDEETHFDPSGQSDGIMPTADGLVSDCSLVGAPQFGTVLIQVPVEPGGLYGLVVNGFAHDQCKVEFLSASNIGAPAGFEIPSDNSIVNGFNGDTICLGGQDIEFSLEEEVSLASGYNWWLNGELVDSTSFPTAGLNFTLEGINEVCVSAYNSCVESDQKCVEVYVRPIDTIYSFLTLDTTCVGNYYNWIGPSNDVLVFFPIQADTGDFYYETDVIDSIGCPSTHAELFLHVKEELSAEVETTDVTCHGDLTGSVQIEVINATPPYELEIIGTDSTSNLAAGKYTYIVTDHHGCVLTDSFEIKQPPPIGFAVVETGHSGEFDDEGYVFVEAEGGVSPYLYEWYSGDSLISVDSGLVDVSAGEYLLVITDAELCSDSFIVEVFEDRGVPENDLCENSLQMGVVTSDIDEVICFEMSNLNASPALFDLANIQNPANYDTECLEEPVLQDMAGVWFEFTTDEDAGRIEVTLEHENEVYLGFLMYEVTGDCDEEMTIRICERDFDEMGFIEFNNYGVDTGTTYRIFLYTDKEEAGEYELCINVKPPKECLGYAPYYYNHTDVLCGLEALEEFCLLMGPPFPPAFLSWPGCEGCCAFHNPQWFTFVAGEADTLSLDVFISDCQNNQGVQIALYELGCDVPFDPTEQSTGIQPTPDQMVSDCNLVSSPQNGTVNFTVDTEPGQVYGIVVDGWANDQCKVEIVEVLSGGDPPELGEDPIGKPVFDPIPPWDKDTICAGAVGVPFTLDGEVPNACTYIWTLSNLDLMGPLTPLRWRIRQRF
jgi:hypothetical protein